MPRYVYIILFALALCAGRNAAASSGHYAQPTVRLRGGIEMPTVGIATEGISQGIVAEHTLAMALDAGYRHIQVANDSPNLGAVASAITNMPREQLWISAKMHADSDSGAMNAEIDSLLQRLGTPYLDLAYFCRPGEGWQQSWHELEQAVADGRIRALGVCDFDDDILEQLTQPSVVEQVREIRHLPDVVQIKCSPLSDNSALTETLGQLGIVVECLCPLDTKSITPALLADPLLCDIASIHGKTPLQILLQWHLQQGMSVVTVPTDTRMLPELIAIGDFTLSPHELATLSLIAPSTPSPLLTLLGRLINGYQLYTR